MSDDITDQTIPLKVRTIRTIVVCAISTTAVVVLGWADLKANADEAKKIALSAARDVASFKQEIKEIKCIMRQQTDYMIYKKFPPRESSCENIAKVND